MLVGDMAQQTSINQMLFNLCDVHRNLHQLLLEVVLLQLLLEVVLLQLLLDVMLLQLLDVMLLQLNNCRSITSGVISHL